MKEIANILSLLAIGILMIGCGTPVCVPAPKIEETPNPIIGTITLIRIEPEPTAPELLVYLKDTLVAVIGNQSYATIPLEAGTHRFILDWEDTPLQFEETFELDPAIHPERYLSLNHHFDVPEISKSSTSTDYTMEETLALFELPSTFGKNLITNLDPDFSYVAAPEEYQLEIPK